ncbi:hypothetical protein PVK06_031100 [Gossypium arboreum]|uniref:Uncharacterized protein n=1 Tax=Gossypium arboreum TaxID=29729 RepID=A0ABR0NQ31_GOSAR|nr:hypothetical protein PVK06_031100 [Gossypium arboreum]
MVGVRDVNWAGEGSAPTAPILTKNFHLHPCSATRYRRADGDERVQGRTHAYPTTYGESNFIPILAPSLRKPIPIPAQLSAK